MMMKKLLALSLIFLGGCSGVSMHLINDSGGLVKNVEIKAGAQSMVLPELAQGADHKMTLKIEKPLNIGVNYQTAQGQQYFTGSSVTLNPGDGGSLRLSITAKGTLEAVRNK